MACVINVDLNRAKALKALYDYCGSNCSMFYSYLTAVIKDVNSQGELEFTDEFKHSWKERKSVNINESDPVKVKDAIIKFYNEKYPSVEEGTRKTKNFDKIKIFGYTNISAREEGKRHFANKMIQAFDNNKNAGENEVKTNVKAYCAKYAMAVLKKTLVKRLSKLTGVNEKEVLDNIKTNGNIYLNDVLKNNKDNINSQLENLIALYKEFSTVDMYTSLGIEKPANAKDSNPYKEFIQEVLYDSRLSDIGLTKKEDEEAIENAFNEDSFDDVDIDDDQQGEAEYDTYIQTLNNKLGLSTSFMTYLGANVKHLLGSLPKMTTDELNGGKFVKDTDNWFGIPDVMDANQCASILYHYGKFDNPAVMIQSIRDIAKQLPGYQSFDLLADKLEQNPNLQLEFYRAFKRTVISKLETVIENGIPKTRIANSAINKEATLKFQFINALKSSSLKVIPEYASRQAGLLKTVIDDYNEVNDTDDNQLRDIIKKLTEQFKAYYPEINEFSIRNYIIYNKGEQEAVNKKANLLNIYNNLVDTIDASTNTIANYKNKQAEVAKARLHNTRVRTGKEESNIIDLNSIYLDSYIDDTAEAAATRLTNLIADYTTTYTPLNTRTIDGKSQADTINNSMLTSIRDTLQSKLNKFVETTNSNGVIVKEWDEKSPVMQLAKHRFQSKQYDFSTIMLEHRDENDNIINYGLFRAEEQDDGTIKYVPTDECLSLLQIHLYQGASDVDSGDNILYSKMSKGDYIATAWKNFFNSTNNINGVDMVADYFMRIPSDAPKTFCITAPRYSIKGLLKAKNTKQLNDNIKDFINKVSNAKLDTTSYIGSFTNPITVRKDSKYLNGNDFYEHLMTANVEGDTNLNIRIPLNRQRLFKDDKTKTISIAFRYASSDAHDKNTNVYQMTGVYYNGVLHNAKFVGFNIDSIDYSIWNDIRTIYFDKANKNGDVEWNISETHPIFRQLKNVFRQELTDMATASSVMFETVRDKETGNWRIKCDAKGHPIFNKKSKLIESNEKHNGLHPTYHYKESKNPKEPSRIYTVDKDGNAKATGKVFTSDRFIVYDYMSEEQNPTRNFGEEILNEGFGLFTKRTTDTKRVLQFDKEGNVVLTDEQEQLINDKIKEFVLTYIESAKTRLNEFENLIEDNETKFNTENIAEFMLNTHLAYVGFNDFFEGDTKFYEDTQIFLKRAKEAQGSGVSYGVSDITKPIQPGHNPIDSPLDNAIFMFKAKNGNQTQMPIKMFDTFSAITIYNTVLTDQPMIDRLVKHLSNKDVMGKAVLSEEKAKELMEGFGNTKVNDAQSYITFQEWVRRITARGQLPQYKNLIDRVLDETKELTVDDVTKLIQVQKNFYYDQYYNEDTKTVSPRQIKNAEFVLVPRLIRGTELEKVAKLMRKLGIDQLNTAETSKAGQSYKFTLWGEDGHISDDILSDIDNPNKEEYTSEIMKLGKEAKEYYNYNYLYTQQETSQHINDENKAGLQIVKKIVDNIDVNSNPALKKAKDDFFKLYAANIKADANSLLATLGVKINTNGEFTVDKNNAIEGLDYGKLFDMLKEELNRLGLDSNMNDYCTQDPNGVFTNSTIMPNYMSLVAFKFENIVQSLFNNRIVRQTLPGFHAAQITGIGFKSMSEQVDKSRTSNKLQYHPNLYKKDGSDERITERELKLLSEEEQKQYKFDRVAPYVEIMLPASNFGFKRSDYPNMTKEEQNNMFLKQLQKYHLDEILGYRIPTEGKQSICCMKVVDFTDDGYGSTIVVPDAWVSQTGSDFDIDSVYGIQYDTYIDSKGQIKRYEYTTDTNELYKQYILRNMSKEERQQYYEDLKFNEQTINDFKKRATDENGNFDKQKYNELLQNGKEQIIEANLEDIAEEKGLLSKEEFGQQSIELQNSKQARNNAMLDNMKKMLTDNESLEENLSRSNFDKITDALDKFIVGNTRTLRNARTAYNIIDQAEMQEDAMSGAQLKGISIMRDTFCSVCNTVHPTLENNSAIKVFYSISDLRNIFSIESSVTDEKAEEIIKENLKARFGENSVSSSTGGFIVTHNTFGWSLDNKNIDGYILTAYSSQTTAHILDAIKVGNVPNVNTETFKVYKTLVDIGSNYDTAISFIMQPGVKRIVDEFNKVNSIYSPERSRNFVRKAVQSILDELHIDYEPTASLEEMLGEVNNMYDDVLEEIFGNDFSLSTEDEDNAKVALNSKVQYDRLKEEGIFASTSPVEENDRGKTIRLLYDLQTILTYNKINNLAKDIEKVVKVSNPDKFGAKQTIYETRQVFDDICNNIVDSYYERKDGTVINNFRLQANGKNILEVLYPNIQLDGTLDDAIASILNNPNFENDSVYPPLAACLKYGTALSININKSLFVTQSDAFVDYINNPFDGLKSVIPISGRLNPKTAKHFQDYVINYVVSQSRFLQTPLRYVKGRGRTRGFDYNTEVKFSNEDEITRVFGFNRSPNYIITNTIENENGDVEETQTVFEVENVNDPTQEEIDNFNQLTPAQKISWIKEHFRNTGVFDYVDVSLFNEKARGKKAGQQTIEFREEAADIETVRKQFELAYTHTNPLVACAAADMIKYAFIVEGYRMGMRNISKMIPNSVLLNGGRIWGTSIVNDSNDKMRNLDIMLRDSELKRNIIESFVRGNASELGINVKNVTRLKNGFELIRHSGNVLHLNLNNETQRALASKYGFIVPITESSYKTNSYVKLRFGKDTILYKIDVRDGADLFLTPLNELKSTENAEWSTDDSLHKFRPTAYYEELIDNYLKAAVEQRLNDFNSKLLTEEVKKLNNVEEYAIPAAKKIDKTTPTPIEDFNTNQSYDGIRESISEWYANSINDAKPVKYMWYAPFSKHIKAFGTDKGLIQRINLTNGGVKDFLIRKVNVERFVKRYTGQNINKPIEKYDAPFEELINLVRQAYRDLGNNLSIYFGDIYAIEPVDMSTLEQNDIPDESTIEEVAVQSVGSIYKRSHNLVDSRASRLNMLWKNKDIRAKKDKIPEHVDDVIIGTAKYVEETTDELLNKIDNYIQDPETGEWLKMNDIKCIDLIKKDHALRNDYLKTLLDAQAIIEDFSLIKELDIESEDPNIQQSLNKIKSSLTKLENKSIIADCYEKFAQRYYDEGTDNPLVRQGLMSVLDGYYKTNWFNAMFNDIQETSNPIVQIAMKNFQNDLNAKAIAGKKRAIEFAEYIKQIQQDAAKHGARFDLSKIIDEYGRFKQNHNTKFIEDRNRLQRAVNAEKEGTVAWFKAKLEYDEWKAKHIEQPVVTSYYEEKNAVLRKMLYGDPELTEEERREAFIDKNADYLAKYEQLRLERKNLRSKYKTDEPDPELDKKLDALDNKIWAMTYPNEGDDEISETLKARLNNYIKGLRNIENKYFKYDPAYNFEQLVERNERIVQSYELSGRPVNLYSDNPEYVKAKTWLKRNVILEPDWTEEIKGKIEKAYSAIVPVNKESMNHTIRGNKKYYNSFGEFDPRLVPDNLINKLRNEEETNYGIVNGLPFSDRTLINNSNYNGQIYNKAFYEGFTDSKGKEKLAASRHYRQLITAINNILAPWYNERTGEIDLENIENTDENIKNLRTLRKLYDELDEIGGGKKSKTVRQFIKDNVEFTHNKEKYESDNDYVKTLSKGDFRSALMDVIKDVDYDGNVVPNKRLYGIVKPKDKVLDKYLDADKTEAVATLNKYKGKRLSNYYAEAKYEARQKGEAYYNAWIARNHVYNPYNHAYQPLDIWYESYDKADNYNHYPKFSQTVRSIRDGYYTHKEAVEELDNQTEYDTVKELEEAYFPEKDYVNKNYKDKGGHEANYKFGSNKEYDVSSDANEYELRAKNYIQETLMKLANTQDSKTYLENGWLPAKAKTSPTDAKGWVKEVLKIVGISSEVHNDKWYDSVDYSKDKPDTMPMLERLKGKCYKDIPKKPIQKEGQSDEDYAKAIAKWEIDVADIKKNNLEIHKALLDNDWIGAIQDFIIQAATYNAVQDNKYELFYAQQLLKRYGHYIQHYDKFGNLKFKKDLRNSSSEDAEYLRKQDTELIKQFDNQLKRILYNQFKANNKPKLLNSMSVLQSITSAQFMMFNFKGGIANVTLGEHQLFGEAFAGEFLGVKDWGKGKLEYSKGVADYVLNSESEKSNTLQGAIIKMFDVVDYDEWKGVSDISKDAAYVLRKLRNYGYAPQTSGEHAMQNSALFSMLYSHRLVLNKRREEFGQPKYTFKNLNEFKIDNHRDALLSILDDNEKQAYLKYEKDMADDANSFKDFAWRRKDLTTNFVRDNLSKEKQEEFLKKRNELDKKSEKEFNDDTKHPTLISQLELTSDGRMGFKKDSMLAEMDVQKEDGSPTDAIKLIANMKGRVIAVNKYIHGVYDKSGRAQFENTFIGSLVMQYHKHIPLGIMKRYRVQGMWHEQRGAVSKGMYTSLYDFLTIPFKKHQKMLNMTDDEVNSARSIQKMLGDVVDFAFNVKMNYELMPEYDRANIKRCINELSGMMAALFMCILIKAGWDDDDKDGLLYNLALYEIDRYATEVGQYNPIIGYSEAKKLWQSPIAANSGVTDLLSSANQLCHMMLDGEDFDGTYKSGKFAGQSKIKVYVERRIPIWRGIKTSFIDIVDNNHYYKVGENVLGFINADKRAEDLKEYMGW